MVEVNKYLEKLERVLLIILVLLLPTQLGLHFWPEWSHIYGIRIDYLSPTIYLTDLVIIVLLSLGIVTKKLLSKKNLIIFVFVLLVSLINIYFSNSYFPALLKWLKVFEVVFLYLLLKNINSFNLKSAIKPLSLSLIAISIIGILQLINQQTIGGLFYYLGERSFNSSTPGIALASFFSKTFMRPYSIFSHPNSFAGFAAVSLILVIIQKPQRQVDRYLVITATALGVISVVISMSQAVWLAIVISTIITYLYKKLSTISKPNYLTAFSNVAYWGIVSAGLISIVVAKSITDISILPQQISRRLELLVAAGELYKTAPLFGLGFNNFIISLPNIIYSRSIFLWLQPVHNIYSLLLVEVGLLGLIIIITHLFTKYKKLAANHNWKMLFVFFVIMISSLFDHYWITLQQNILLAAMFLVFVEKDKTIVD